MNASSITTSAFTLYQNSVQINGTATYNSSTKTATFTPSSALDYGTIYTATISTDARDSAGNAMKSNYSWSFTTKQAPGGGNPSYLMGGSIQGNALKLTNSNAVITTLAGSGAVGLIDGTGTAARFNYPIGMTTDGANLYVADTLNNIIRKISPIAAAPSSAPGNLAATNPDRQVTLSWDSVSGATSYNIYWSASSGVTTLTGTLAACVTSPYTFTGLTNGNPYYFIATAKNDIGEGPASSQTSASPASAYTLTVSKSGTGSGSVSSSPSGISCGSTCTASVTNGLQVTLTASASSGSTFSGWSGACSGTGSCTVTMDSNKSVTATFTKSSGGGGGQYYWYNWNCGSSSSCASFFSGKHTGSLGPFCTQTDCTSWATKYGLVNACSATAIYETETAPTANGVCAQNGVDF